jgi:SAM-dependent methyltransferase
VQKTLCQGFSFLIGARVSCPSYDYKKRFIVFQVQFLPVHTMDAILKNKFRRLIFELWYFRSPPWDTGISPPELYSFLENHPSGRALDLGCGTGTNVITLARHGWQVTGVDFSRKAIRMAHRKLKEVQQTARLRVADASRLEEVDGPFDLILDIGCLHGIGPDRRQVYYANLDRLLAGGGTYLLYAFWQESGSGRNTGLTESDLKSLTQLFTLVDRQDGSERGRRPSTWFTFFRPANG